MTTLPVVVVGAGPVGLTMAAELARHGQRCRLIDRLTQPSPYCRAIGVTPRTLEVWEAMDLSDAMIGSGLWLRGMRSVIAGGPAQHRSGAVHRADPATARWLGCARAAHVERGEAAAGESRWQRAGRALAHRDHDHLLLRRPGTRRLRPRDRHAHRMSR